MSDPAEEDRIEPNVWIRRQTRLLSFCAVEWQALENIDDIAVGLVGSVCDGGLESVTQIEDDVRRLDMAAR